ncbi:MAG: outer membrane lipoprotein carrier protein LolA [Rickettsiales bacterium]
MLKKTIIFFVLMVMPISVAAEEVSRPEVVFLKESQLAPHQATIAKVEKYLSSLTTITSEFVQAAPDGGLASGKFFLKRPGKMRWQYNPPIPILMIADGFELIYYDYELEQISHIPMDSTLIGFLAKEKISLGDEVGIISFEESTGSVRIGLTQREKPEEGQLVLEFTNNPLLIRNMIVTDTNGKTTTVSLNKAKFGVKIDDKLFIFKDPRKPLRRL